MAPFLLFLGTVISLRVGFYIIFGDTLSSRDVDREIDRITE